MQRDMTRLPLVSGKELLIASDISSGIGEQELDVLRASYEVVGAFAARVAMLEIMAARGTVKALQYMVGGAYDPVVVRVRQGIASELDKAGLSSVPINGSHESNMQVSCTSVGVTAIGEGDPEEGHSHSAYVLYVMGRPLVGHEVLEQPESIVSYEMVRSILQHPGTERMLPVGSRGIAYEVHVMTSLQGRGLEDMNIAEDLLHHSGGPSTSVLVAVRSELHHMWAKEFPDALYIGKSR